jgi:hypothetical protein
MLASVATTISTAGQGWRSHDCGMPFVRWLASDHPSTGRLEDGQPASAMENGTLAPLIGSLAAFDRQPRLSNGAAPRCKAIGK